MQLKYHKAAREEYFSHLRWMKAHDYPASVIEKFIQEIRSLEQEILLPANRRLVAQPELGERRVWRSSRSKTFSFRLYYVCQRETVTVIAAANPSREPEYWKDRKV